MKVSVLCFDISNNSLGRAWLLAQALSRFYDVEIIGPSRKDQIWTPMEKMGIPIKKFAWKRYPAFSRIKNNLLAAIDGDVVLASKLMPTSFGVGLQKKKSTGKPLILDIDDWELGFFFHSGFFGKVGRFLNFSNPNGLPYAWRLEQLVGQADAITVSNRFLQKKFGGTLLPHCRNTSELDPLKFNQDEMKKKLGLTGKKVLMFLGTPRPHKGIDDLLIALKKIQNPGLCLVIIGSDNQPKFMKEVDKSIQDRIFVLPEVSFDKLPNYLSAADILVIPQRLTSDSVGQMPAKLYDAMAMAKPVLATRVSDIPEVLGNCGYLVNPGEPSKLGEAIQYILDNPAEAFNKGKAAREKCQRNYDIKILESGLQEIVERVTMRNKHT